MKKFTHPSVLYFVVLLWCALLIGTVTAQTSGSASLRGTVTDPSGAVVPNAKIALRDEQTQQERFATTNQEGGFVFASLTPGVFTVKVEGTGFKSYTLSKFMLSPSETRGLNITLEVGAATETVTITGEAAQIQTETGEKAYTITAAQIENLSLISRSSLELLRILPGVVGPEAETLDFTGFQQGGNANNAFSVNGQRGQNINISVDGSITKDVGANNGTIITPNNDMVKEVRVQTSNYAAEFGTSTLQITAVTKSGGKQFHGSLYEYARNQHLNANDRARNYSGLGRPETSQYYTGGNLGGPVKLPSFLGGDKTRDRVVLFYGLEFQRQRNTNDVVFGVVPTAKQRQGDFSEFLPCANIGNPTGCTTTYLLQNRTLTVPQQPPAGFTVGQSLVSNNFNLNPFKDATNLGPTILDKLFPQPNYNDPTGRFNYVSGATLPLDRTDQKLRVDYKVSDRTNLYARLAREKEDEEFAYGVWGRSSMTELYSHTNGDHIGRSAAVNMVTVFDPSLTMEVVFSASKLKLYHEYIDYNKVSPQALGLSNLKLPFGYLGKSAPRLILSGFSAGLSLNQVGNNQGETPLFAFNSSYSVNSNVTKIKGAHTYKFGGLLEQVNKKQNLGNQYNGVITLNTITNGTGNPFGNLYIGRPGSVQQSNFTPEGEFRAYNIDAYAQDSWKLKSNLTFEYGLRVVGIPNNKERNGYETWFDPNLYQKGAGAFINGDLQKPNGIALVSRGQAKPGIVPDPKPQMAPRVSFAWDVSKKGNFVVRGGYGLFYNRSQGNFQYSPALQNAPNFINPTVTSTSTASAYKDGIADLTLARLNQVDLARVPLSITPVSINPDGVTPTRTANSSFSLARRLWWGNVLEVGYVGNQVRHLPQVRNLNVVPIGALLKGTITSGTQVVDLSNPINRMALSTEAFRSLLPYPDYNGINIREYVGTSSYHSGQLTLSRQQSRGLTYTAAYTFSKALGILGGDGGTNDPLDARNRSYGVQTYDRTHNLVVNYNYNLPNLARGAFRNKLTGGFLNGWQLSGISTYQSGAPIRIFFSGGSGTGTGNSLQSTNAWQSWFGTNAFAGAGATNIGGIAPILLRNPQIAGSGAKVGDKLFDVSAIGIPNFGESGAYQSPFYIRLPNRNNHDMTLMKNFRFKESKNIQIRAGFFNIFNQAFVTRQADIDLTLQTTCNVRAASAPNGTGGTVTNVCDPSKGYVFNDTTNQNFGKVITKRGNRRVQLQFRFTF
ncbi:MAG: carboxypeptidase-like regulatory domain-containing protein [Blastocatellia bacterium]